MSKQPDKPPKDAPPRPATGLGTPQFDLRTLMLVVFCISAVLAVHVRFGALAASALTLAILAIGAHVAANAIGTKLRDHRGDESKRRTIGHREASSGGELSSENYAPTTRLGARSRQGWAAIIVTTAGSIMSTLAGMGLFAIVLGEESRLNLLLVGGLAIGVLGGIASFGAFSFMRVTSSALSQAVREPRRDGS